MSEIKIDEVYDKNINFLIGSGASYGLFPTLALNLKKDLSSGENHTIETLGKHLAETGHKNAYNLLFMHYYKNCILPVQKFDIDAITTAQAEVINNYEVFIKNILSILDRREPNSKKCNIFTTNYDSCLELTADRILKKERANFILNDGSTGFKRRILHPKNFSTTLYHTGVFNQHKSCIPQINLMHIHGSVYWKKYGSDIEVNYFQKHDDDLISSAHSKHVEDFSAILNDATKNASSLDTFKSKRIDATTFWAKYNEIPIVNPTKWKFHETVFDEHYYQMLRFLSYELEKENSVLITFGFSFADEHIRNLVIRSIANPKLQIFICCFDAKEAEQMSLYFKEYKNVQIIEIGENLNFKVFNEQVFSLEKKG